MPLYVNLFFFKIFLYLYYIMVLFNTILNIFNNLKSFFKDCICGNNLSTLSNQDNELSEVSSLFGVEDDSLETLFNPYSYLEVNYF